MLGLYQKACKYFLGREFFGHEAQLDEGAHAIGQQVVVDLIDVGEVVLELALVVLVIDTDFVVKDGVKANVFEVGHLLHFAKVAAVAVTQGENRATGPEHFFPEVGEGMSCG